MYDVDVKHDHKWSGMMPELPEVQTVVDDLNQCGILGECLNRVIVRWRNSVAGASDAYLRSQLRGQVLTGITRRAKYIVLHFSKRTVLIHLRMSGRIHYTAQSVPHEKHEHVILQFSNQHDIRFHDPRKFGRFYAGKYAQGRLTRLGIEPLSTAFSAQQLFQILHARNRQLKPLLLDQTLIAGLGNIYVDEALWSAKLHPQRISSTLAMADAMALCKSIRLVLRRGLRNAGTSLGRGKGNFTSLEKREGQNKSALKAYGREGQPCLDCRKPMHRIQVAQRSSFLCLSCQI